MEVRCADLGLQCSGSVSADTEQELAQALQQHAADRHDVPALNATLTDYALSRARHGDGKDG
jgi:predicted small metal-binding protein